VGQGQAAQTILGALNKLGQEWRPAGLQRGLAETEKFSTVRTPVEYAPR